MKDHYDNFYKKSSKKFKKYEFHGQDRLVTGKKPNFFEYLKKFANKNFKILDLGCGSGELTLKLSPFFKEIIGIDPFEDYIETAEKQKKKSKIKNVIFKVADGKKLSFEDEYFDIVFSSRGPLSADIDFIKESFRVLKKLVKKIKLNSKKFKAHIEEVNIKLSSGDIKLSSHRLLWMAWTNPQLKPRCALTPLRSVRVT